MRLVGPRPEDPRFVDMANPLHYDVFSSTPGITGVSQLVFEDEAFLLDEGDPEGSYGAVLSNKLALDSWYLARRSTRLDLWIIGKTVRAVVGRSPTTADEVYAWR